METRDYYYYAYKKYKAKLKKLQRSQYRGGAANPFASLSQDDDDDDDDEPEVEETIEIEEEEPLEGTGKGNRRFKEGDEVAVVTTEGDDITSQRGKCIKDSDGEYYINTIPGPKKKVTEDTETPSFKLIPSYYQY